MCLFAEPTPPYFVDDAIAAGAADAMLARTALAGSASTLAASVSARCPACDHTGEMKRHALRACWWRDVPSDGRPQVRRGHIVRWRCTACLQTHSSQPSWALPGKRLTRELDHWVRQALQSGQSVRAVARACGVDDKTVRAWARHVRKAAPQACHHSGGASAHG
jgi:transposase-like protein